MLDFILCALCDNIKKYIKEKKYVKNPNWNLNSQRKIQEFEKNKEEH